MVYSMYCSWFFSGALLHGVSMAYKEENRRTVYLYV